MQVLHVTDALIMLARIPNHASLTVRVQYVLNLFIPIPCALL